MPLSILIPLTFGGVLLIVLFVHITGGSKVKSIEHAQEALKLLRQEHPEVQVEDVVLLNTQTIALLHVPTQDAVAMVCSLGAHHTINILTSGRIARAKIQSPQSVRLFFHDAGLPPRTLYFEHVEQQQVWSTRLGALATETNKTHSPHIPNA